MAVVRKKQDDKYLKILRELITSGGGNRQCFDCGQKGPTYVNMTIGSFVCTRCSGVLRGLTPPHRVKSISMATFTPEEIEFLKGHGNDVCAKTWLGLWDPKRVIQQDQRELMIDKYERKRYYLEPASPLKSLTNTTTATTPKLSSSMSNGNSNSSSNISINSSSSNLNNNNNNNFIHNLNGSINNNNNNNKDSIKNSLVENNYKNMSLTPPSSLRITANGMLGGGGGVGINNINSGSGTGSGGGSGNSGGGGGSGVNGSAGNIIGTIGNSNLNNGHLRQNNKFNFQNQFTTNENGLYNGNNINKNNSNTGSNSNALMNGFNMNGNGNAIYSTINKNGLNGIPSTTLITGNAASVTGTTINNSDKNHHGFTPDSDFVADFGSANIFNATAAATNPLNGFKLQSSQQQQHSQNNGISGVTTAVKSTAFTNGGGIQQQNGFATNHSNVINANENFADFDHAPIIYNAAGLPLSNSTSNSISSSSSLSSATFNSNSSSMNSTPPADRYAALKDLDEQLRESKAAASMDTSFSSVQVASQQSSVNPFKMAIQQPPTQSQQIINPFQANFNNNNNHHQVTTNNIFGTPTPSQQMMVTGCGNGNVGINGNGNMNGCGVGFNVTANNNNMATVTASTVFGTQPTPISAAAAAGAGFNNGYVIQPTALITNNLNGCNGNLRFGTTTTTQDIQTGNSIAANLKNPFATTSSLNSNNPFL